MNPAPVASLIVVERNSYANGNGRELVLPTLNLVGVFHQTTL
jgi:hypothetical protein